MLDAIALNKLNFATDQISLPSPRTTLFIQPPEDNPKTRKPQNNFVHPPNRGQPNVQLRKSFKFQRRNPNQTQTKLYTVEKIISSPLLEFSQKTQERFGKCFRLLLLYRAFIYFLIYLVLRKKDYTGVKRFSRSV